MMTRNAIHRVASLALVFALICAPITGVVPVKQLDPVGPAEAAAGDEVWSASIGLGTMSSPTLSNGVVYIGSDDSNLYAFDAENGSELWSAPTGDFITSSPTISNGVVYVKSNDGGLYAFDAEDGSERWTASTGNDGISETSPTISNGVVYIGSGDGDLYAFDAEDGSERWTASTGKDIDSSPTVSNGVVYVGSHDNSLYAFDAEDGSERWSVSTGDGVHSSPTVSNGVVYVGSYDDNVYAFDAEDGSERWSVSMGANVKSSPTVSNGVVYVGSNDNNLYAFDAEDGSERWNASTGDMVYSSPTVSNGVVYVGSNDNNLYAFDADDGSERWTASTGDNIESSPTVSNGVVYVGSVDSNLYAFETSHSGDSTGTRVTLGTLGGLGSSVGSYAITGRVVTQDGQPVAGASVTVNGINFDNLQGSIEEKQEQADELIDNITDYQPDAWNPNLPIRGDDGIAQHSGTEFVTINSAEDWGTSAWGPYGWAGLDDPDLTSPVIQLDPNKDYQATIWDPNEESFIEDAVDRDVHGATTTGTVVVEQIVGDTPTTHDEVDTEPVGKTSNYGLGKTHETADLSELSTGFYRVYPKGSPESSYIVVVGSVEQAAQAVYDDMTGLGDDVNTIEPVQTYQDAVNDSQIVPKTVTTDANGYYRVDVPDNWQTVHVQAYKAPDAVGDPSSVRLSDANEFYQTKINKIQAELGALDPNADDPPDLSDFELPSVYLPSETRTVNPPRQDLELTVREESASDYTSLKFDQTLAEWFEYQLRGIDSPIDIEWGTNPVNIIDEELRDLYHSTLDLIRANPALEQLLEEEYGVDVDTWLAGDDPTADEMRERIDVINTAWDRLQADLVPDDGGDIEDEIGNNTITKRFNTGVDVPEDAVFLTITYPNASKKVINTSSEYLYVDEGTLGDTLVLEEYPIGESDGAAFKWDLWFANENGRGHMSDTQRNPAFGGLLPTIDGLDFSTLRPGVDQTVSMDVIPGEGNFASVEAATVYGPDNSEVSTTIVDGDTVRFETSAGTGPYTVQPTLTSTDGSNVTVPIPIEAVPSDADWDPMLRAESTTLGTIALTGEELSSGSVDTATGGTTAQLTARVGEDVPAGIHTWTDDLTLDSDSRVNLRVIDESGRVLRDQSVGWTAHRSPVEGDAYTYRYQSADGKPIDDDGTAHGHVEYAGNQTLIDSWADGETGLRVIGDPSTVDDAIWWYNQAIERVGLPFVGSIAAAPSALAGTDPAVVGSA